MKLSFKLISILGAVTSVIAQSTDIYIRTCGNEPSPEAVALKEANFAKNKVVSDVDVAAHTPITIRVHFHVTYINTTIDGGYVSDNQITEQIKVLNTAYANAAITFNLTSVSRTEHPDWFSQNTGPDSDVQRDMTYSLRRGDGGDLNFYTVGPMKVSGVNVLGFSTVPSDFADNQQGDGVVVLFSTLPGGSTKGFNLGHTIVHETGHWVGLYHTFQGGCDSTGDYVKDTPAEASPARGCPTGRDTCPGAGPDPIHNFMDYSCDSCTREFTAGQVTRLRSQLATYRGFPV